MRMMVEHTINDNDVYFKQLSFIKVDKSLLSLQILLHNTKMNISLIIKAKWC